jgi:photosynthetic reaction center H subunit
MSKGAFTAYFDVAQLVLYMFWIFFAGLIWYLVRENRREGYPLLADRGRIEGWLPVPEPKVYVLPTGEMVYAPLANPKEEAPVGAQRLAGHGGSAYEPIGNPLVAGVGPGSWASRADRPELDHEGHPKIRPLSALPDFGISPRDPDLRGMTLFDAEGDAAGTVVELWLDVSEMIFRYLEAEVRGEAGPVRVLVPMNFVRVRPGDGAHVHALLANQFAGIPRPRTAGQVTLLEEEKITAYCGAGLLYAQPGRSEPLV